MAFPKKSNVLGRFSSLSPTPPSKNANSIFIVVSPSLTESVLTGVWCVPGFGAGFEIALEPSKLQKEGENSCTFIFCAKLWHAPKPGPKET